MLQSRMIQPFVWVLCLLATPQLFAQNPNQPRPTPQYSGPQQRPAPQPRFPQLPPDQQEYVDDLLNAWQKRSQQITNYQCSFQRWEYDPVFGPQQPRTPTKYSKGVIHYQSPDKGAFKVLASHAYVAPPAGAPQQKPQYAEKEGQEHWVCDGRTVFEFDYANRQVVERPLPPEMQGKAITNGPMPFLFGANAAEIKRRYWVQPLPVPERVKGKETWLDAYPKTQQDAANYQRVRIVFSNQDFLPKSIVVFERNYNPADANPARTAYEFAERVENKKAGGLLPIGRKDPFAPKTPSGWERVVEKPQIRQAQQPGQRR